MTEPWKFHAEISGLAHAVATCIHTLKAVPSSFQHATLNRWASEHNQIPADPVQLRDPEVFGDAVRCLVVGAFKPCGIQAFGRCWCAAHHPGGIEGDRGCPQCPGLWQASS